MGIFVVNTCFAEIKVVSRCTRFTTLVGVSVLAEHVVTFTLETNSVIGHLVAF